MIRKPGKLAIPLSLVILCLVFPTAARAAAVPTSLELEADPVIEVGVHPTVTVRLTSAAGAIVGAALEVRLDGRQTMRLLTDDDGRATTALARDLDAGSYELQAVFRGTPTLLASVSAVTTIRVTPASLTVRTVPPVRGVPLLSIDGGKQLTTGTDGTIRIPITKVRRYELEVTLPPADAARRLTFDRWGDGSREPKRMVRLPGRTDLAIGLEVSHPVAFSFIDSTGAAVDPARVDTLVIANDRGDVLEPKARNSAWLIANRILRGAGGLTSVPIEYRVQEVGVRGSNVVDRGRLHFQPDGVITTWVIPLLLYSLTFSGQDALFGFPLGSSVQLAYPDGTTESVRLDDHASATISALPRGNYRAVVEHSPGIPVSTPLVLSRDQFVRVPVISYLDAALVLGGGLALAVSLVLFGGRPVGIFGRRALRRVAVAVLMKLSVAGALVPFVTRTLRAFGSVIRRRIADLAYLARRVLAVRHVPGRVVRRLSTAAALRHVPGRVVRRLSTAAAFRRPGRPAPLFTILGGSAGPLAVPLEVAAAASPRPRIDHVAAPTSPGNGSRRRYCPECGHRLTSRGRRCRACGWHKS